jgi:hypothetical protein
MPEEQHQQPLLEKSKSGWMVTNKGQKEKL